MTCWSRWNLFTKSSIAASSLMIWSFGAPKLSVKQVANRTKSLVVESLTQDKTGYKICLRNTSTVAVYELARAVTGSKGVCDLHTPRSTSGAIGPNEEREIHLPYTKSKPMWGGPAEESCATATDQVPNGKPGVGPGIMIDAADFTDGTCEGDLAKCAMMEAFRVGVYTQRQRIAGVVQEEIKRGGDEDWADPLALRVSALSSEPEEAIVEAIQIRFQQPASAKESVRSDMENGLVEERGFFLTYVKLYKTMSSKYGKPKTSLQEWWKVTKGRCDFYSPQCC